MLSEEQFEEIREHLNRAQNPVFFFDNDCDGLIGFILLRRYIDRGRGVAIKSFPSLDESYAKKIEEFNADYVFILDKPAVSDDFFEEVERKNIPIVWIDHHDVEVNLNRKNLYYYNPMLGKNKSSEPVSFLTYKISNRNEDLWLSMAGCVADNFIPYFKDDFCKKYKELCKKDNESAFEILYGTDFGKLVMMLNFGLKDRTSNVVSMINFLFKVKNPSEILIEDEKNYKITKRYEQINSVYIKLLEKAKIIARSSKKVVFFQYGGELSLSADLSNELSYRFPGKAIIVAYIKGAIANVSIRGSMDVRKITLEAIKNINGSSGGGHEHATGSKMSVEDLPKFKEFFEKMV